MRFFVFLWGVEPAQTAWTTEKNTFDPFAGFHFDPDLVPADRHAPSPTDQEQVATAETAVQSETTSDLSLLSAAIADQYTFDPCAELGLDPALLTFTPNTEDLTTPFTQIDGEAQEPPAAPSAPDRSL